MEILLILKQAMSSLRTMHGNQRSNIKEGPKGDKVKRRFYTRTVITINGTAPSPSPNQTNKTIPNNHQVKNGADETPKNR